MLVFSSIAEQYSKVITKKVNLLQYAFSFSSSYDKC